VEHSERKCTAVLQCFVRRWINNVLGCCLMGDRLILFESRKLEFEPATVADNCDAKGQLIQFTYFGYYSSRLCNRAQNCNFGSVFRWRFSGEDV
jgi:hypothetical protein